MHQNNYCIDAEESFDRYIESIGAVEQFILTSILGNHGSNLTSAFKVLL